MARVKRNADLGTREARRRLKVHSEPYWLVLERGLSLGYRKSAEGGAWIVRRYEPSRRRHVEHRLTNADDHRDADGTEVLSFGQAQRKALTDAKFAAERASGRHYTVADAVTDYVTYLQAHRKSASDTELKLKAYVLPHFGTRQVADLVRRDLDQWVVWAMKRSPRRKSKGTALKPTQTRKGRHEREDAEDRGRRRKATVNRVIAALKACLNHAHSSGHAPSREAWAGLKKFRGVDSARLRWLTLDEATRLLNACGPDFRPLVRAALLTGCRQGELLASRVRDFDPRSKTLLVPDSKAGKPRRVPMTDAGVELFEALTVGRHENERLFRRVDGSDWHRVAIIRAIQEACSGAKITPPATFHSLRHTYASHLVQKGAPLLFVASALGHRDTRMVEKHYGHLAPSHVAEMIREKLPNFGTESAKKVVRIRR